MKEEKTLLKYMYSFKNIFSENINLNSLMILSGPTGHGKSWLLNKCLHQFLQSNTQPQVGHLEIPLGQNFDMFLYEFENQWIKIICRLSQSPSDLTSRTRKILKRFYEDILIEQQIYKILRQSLEHCENLQNAQESWLTFPLNLKNWEKEIQDFLTKYEQREYKQTPLLDNLEEILEVLKKNYEEDEQLALMRLIQAVMVEKENDRKPSEFYYWSHRDGKETLNFFFDIINDFTGYTELYYDELKMTDEEWKEMVKPMRGNRDHPYLQDSYPHALMAIEKAERLLEMNDQRAEDWLHALMIRTFNDTRFRRHFPVFLETSDWSYFSVEIYNKLNLWNLSFPTLHVDGFGENALAPRLSKVYNQVQLEFLEKTFGKNASQLHLFTEVAIRSKKTFSELIKSAPTTLPELSKARNVFYHRVNKLYLNKHLGPELDSGEIDFLILHIFKRTLRSSISLLKV